MRVSEWIDLAAFVFLTVLAWVRRLPVRRRIVVTSFGVGAVAATLLAAAFASSIFRDWLPAALLLIVYWQAGQFFTRADVNFQKRLLDFDRRTVLPLARHLASSGLGRALLTYVELAYLFCYPMVPAALGALYLLHARRQADHFWSVVLISTYSCYLMVPFIQTLPPRALADVDPLTPVPNPVRSLNLWILLRASIQMNTFPSAHVASSLACALVLCSVSAAAGAVFLAIAISIALGAVLGRYHYAADAILGAAIACVAAVAWLGI